MIFNQNHDMKKLSYLFLIFSVVVQLSACTSGTDNLEATNNKGVKARITVNDDDSVQLQTMPAENKMLMDSVSAGGACAECGKALEMVYSRMDVKTDKEYLYKLHEVYKSENQQEVNQKTSNGLSLKVPDYGTGLWNSNKQKVNTLVQKYSGVTDVSLSFEDHSTLTQVFTTETAMENQLKAWSKCMAGCQGLSSFEISDTAGRKVLAKLYLPATDRTQNLRVRLTGIVASSNLRQVTSGILNRPAVRTGQRLSYGNEYLFEFNRTNDEAGYVQLAVERERDLYVSFPKITYEPEYDWKKEPGKLEFDVTVNRSKKTLTISGNPNPIRISSKVKPISIQLTTNLSIDSSRITGVYPVETAGMNNGAISWKKLEQSGQWFIESVIAARSKTMTVHYTIDYEKLTRVCVRNCR
jgi:hypothetical protein